MTTRQAPEIFQIPLDDLDPAGLPPRGTAEFEQVVIGRNRSLSGVLFPPAPTRNNASHVHEGGTRSDQGDSDQQQVAAA